MFTFPKVLKNGAKVLRLKVNFSSAKISVLCHWEENEVTPYVTWTCDEKGNAFWGHYFRELGDAIEYFKENY